VSDPFRPPESAARTPEFEPRLASRTARLGAAVIDRALFFASTVPGGLVLRQGVTEGQQFPDPQVVLASTLVAVLCMLGTSAVQWALITKTSQSVGKRLVGIRIRRTSGARVAFLDGVVFRDWPMSWFKFVVGGALGQALQVGPFGTPIMVLVITAVDALPMLGPRRRCVHDYLAGTVVTSVADERDPPEPHRAPPVQA
jgi:uncharacterized RDD family membrane protein YckC